jgi:hypothetical protein
LQQKNGCNQNTSYRKNIFTKVWTDMQKRKCPYRIFLLIVPVHVLFKRNYEENVF